MIVTCYVANKHGDHEVHKETCRYVPKWINQIPLGAHPNAYSAVQLAVMLLGDADGCFHCCREAHTK